MSNILDNNMDIHIFIDIFIQDMESNEEIFLGKHPFHCLATEQ